MAAVTRNPLATRPRHPRGESTAATNTTSRIAPGRADPLPPGGPAADPHTGDLPPAGRGDRRVVLWISIGACIRAPFALRFRPPKLVNLSTVLVRGVADGYR